MVMAAVMLIVIERPAYAYIDPGSGGMLVQLLLGGAAGVAVVIKLFWHRFMKMIGLRDKGE
jgi:hypothetical protein